MNIILQAVLGITECAVGLAVILLVIALFGRMIQRK